MITIENISKHKQYEQEVAEWLYSQWGFGFEKGKKYWQDWVASSQNEKSNFQTFIILDDNIPVGTYGLMPCDLQSRQDLSPWVGNLFIHPKYRLKSLLYFSKINQHFKQIKQELNIDKFYIYTKFNPIVYIRYGFKLIDKTTDIEGTKISLLEIS